MRAIAGHGKGLDAARREVTLMRIFRLYSGDDQQSHLEELKMSVAPAGANPTMMRTGRVG